MKYYHITAPKNIDSILENGLRANADGDIFLFENKSIIRPYSIFIDENREWKMDESKKSIALVADIIAMGQVFLDEYAMFEVAREGIDSDMIPDNVAEESKNFQWIAKQPVISPQFINLFGVYEVEGWKEYNPQE